MLSFVNNIDGTTTMVRASSGMPSLKSMRGSGCGEVSWVAMKFTSASASWLEPIAAITPSSTSSAPSRPFCQVCSTTLAVNSAVSTAIAPR